MSAYLQQQIHDLVQRTAELEQRAERAEVLLRTLCARLGLGRPVLDADPGGAAAEEVRLSHRDPRAEHAEERPSRALRPASKSSPALRAARDAAEAAQRALERSDTPPAAMSAARAALELATAASDAIEEAER